MDRALIGELKPSISLCGKESILFGTGGFQIRNPELETDPNPEIQNSKSKAPRVEHSNFEFVSGF
jgi:hypothetical protein